MNTELCRHYLSLEPVTELFRESSFATIIPALDKHFKGEWTWEVTDEKFAMGDSTVCTTVAVYIPGRILSGRSLCKVINYNENHLRAIVDAVSVITVKEMTVKNSETNKEDVINFTAEEIAKMIEDDHKKESELPISNTVQIDNYKDDKGIPNQGVPYDQITNNCINQMIDEIAKPKEDENSDLDVPQARLKGFTQRQVNRINEIKKAFDITDDKQFTNYLKLWKPSITCKADLKPDNVEEWFKFIEEFRKNTVG